MSKDGSSIRRTQSKPPQSDENEFESPWNQIPIIPSRPPLNSIPDPSQYDKPSGSSRKHDAITELPLTPRIYGRGGGKALHSYSEPNSAHATPIRAGARLCGASSGGLRRGGMSSRVPRGISNVAVSQQLLLSAAADVLCFELDENLSFWKDHNVQVLIRVRPLNSVELVAQGLGRCLRQESAQTLVWHGQPETRFTFDHIAGENTSQEKLFRVAGLPMVDNCMSGYNSCMFAYGQTGSGKTYTMMGEIDKMDGQLSDDCGITPRIFEYLFTKITEEEESRKHERLAYSCKCSFLEIYNEQITDLLEPSSANLQLREDSKKGVYVENLTEYSVRTVNDVLRLLQQGAANRKIAATHMNSESSRSHSVFTCIIESRWEKDSMAHLRFGRLNLVDLAGSERQKSSGAEGDRLKEAANINKSLSTLGLVIMSLVDLAQGKQRHIPYRDSRLTFLLQDSLGGNSKTMIIANVSPSTCSAGETLSTLKFAQRAKLIQNNAKINEDASGNVIVLQQQIQQLKDQLSLFMMHQDTSLKPLDFAPVSKKPSFGCLPARYESDENIIMYGEQRPPTERTLKKNHYSVTLSGALRREKLADMEVRRLRVEIEHLIRLTNQQQEEAQRMKMMLRFREEKIKRLELLSDGLISADKFYLDENNALREENLLLQAKIDRNPEVIRYALENIRLLEQIRLYQNFSEYGERETMLAELSDLRNQLLELLEAGKSCTDHHFNPTKWKQELEVADKVEVERCKDMNSKLIREVNDLRDQLANRLNSNQDTWDSTDNKSVRSDSMDEAKCSCHPVDEAVYDKKDHQMEDALILQFDNLLKQLMNAQSLTAKIEPQHFQLIKELQSVLSENQQSMKMECKSLPQCEVEDTHEHDKERVGLTFEDPFATIEGYSFRALQAKLKTVSSDLQEAQMLNRQYTEHQRTRLSQDHQTELVRNEVEMETTRTILHLQEEIDRLQSEFQVRLCSLAEQNLSLRNTVAAKEDEFRLLSEGWERATLELTTFLVDGSRSLGDASRQIKCISSSFPNINEQIGEHIEKAAKTSVEKEHTILFLQNSLEEAQKTLKQMEQQLHSLKGATVALTEFQQLKPSSRVNVLPLGFPDDSFEAREFHENKSKLNENQIPESRYTVVSVAENREFDSSLSSVVGVVDENLSLPHTNAFEMTEIDIQITMARKFLSEAEDAVNKASAEAETFWVNMKSGIHNTISLYRGLVRDFLKDITDIRKDIEELKGNQSLLQYATRVSRKPENKMQILDEIKSELVKLNKKLSSISSQFSGEVDMSYHLDSAECFPETHAPDTDNLASSSNSLVESLENDEKHSSCAMCSSTRKMTKHTLVPICDEGSTPSHNPAVWLIMKEVRKAYGDFIKLMNHLLAVSAVCTNHDCDAEVLIPSDQHTSENFQEQGGDGLDKSTSQRVEAGDIYLGEFAVEETSTPLVNFFAKFEEANATIEEADCVVKAMVEANENANMLTARWKQAGEQLIADKVSLNQEIEKLKSCILLKEREKKVMQEEIKFSLREIATGLLLLEECFVQMQTTVVELFGKARDDAIQVVEGSEAFLSTLTSSLEDLTCKTIQNDISFHVLRSQMGDYLKKLSEQNNILISHRSPIQRDSLVMDHFDMAYDDTVNKNSDLEKELKRKDDLLKGILFDFGLLQEFSAHRKDMKDELEMLVVVLTNVQNELQIKTRQLDDVHVQNKGLEKRLAESEEALFSSNCELDQVKGTLNILSEENLELKGLLNDYYLKNSEAELLVEEQREAIKSLEKEIIRVSSSSENQLVPLAEDIEVALKRVTAERDQLLEKNLSLQEKLDMACAFADENQAIAAEARQESETSKMCAEQKQEEVKILERSVEELECTINVLEKKVLEMEEEIEKHRLMRDSLEFELQELKLRLAAVEDLTESMTSDNSSRAPPEDQLSRKLHGESLEITEAHRRVRFLEGENAKQAAEIKQFKDYIKELLLHADAQASQYQKKYKNLEAMLHEAKTDSSNAPTLERADNISTRTRGSSSPFRCISGLVQQMNQEKDQELSTARHRIQELETLAASRHKEVCILNTRLATAESMTHDVIRDLLSVKLDISNYANIVEQHQLQNLIKEARHQRQEFLAMEQEIVNLRSQIDELLEERERFLSEINRNKADQIATQIFLEQLQERDQLLIAQNDMLKIDKSNLQKRVVELDDMAKKLLRMQHFESPNQPQLSGFLRPFDRDLDERLLRSQNVLSRINNQLNQYPRPDDKSLDDTLVLHGMETRFRT